MRSLFRPALVSCAILLLAAIGEAQACCGWWRFPVLHRLMHSHKAGVLTSPALRGESGAPPSARTEKAPAPKSGTDTPDRAAAAPRAGASSSTLTIASTNPEIAARLQAWRRANPGDELAGPAQRVTIMVDGKPLVLEIRVVSKGPEPIPPPKPVPDTDLAKLVKEALAKDPEEARAKGLSSLAGVYEVLSRAVLDEQQDFSMNALSDLRDASLKNQKAASALKATQAAINTYVNEQTKDLKPGAPLGKGDRAKVSAVFQTVSDTLRGLR